MQTELQTFTFQVDWQHRDGAPNYRYFKLAFTAALRLGNAIELKSPLNIQAQGAATSDPRYKDRQTYEGLLRLNEKSYDDVLFVIDHRGKEPELVTFWRRDQPGEKAGSKGGAHPFAGLYVGYLCGKTTEAKVFDTAAVAKVRDRYNVDRDLNVQAWIVNNLPADSSEPPISQSPIEEPLLKGDRAEYPHRSSVF